MKKISCISILFLLCLSACEEFSLETPEGLVQWDIIKVVGPTSGSINQTILMDVYYPTSSGCDVVTEMLSDRHGNNILIKAFGYSIDSYCTSAAVPKVITYEFSSDRPGQFVLKFINRDNSTIKHYITID